MQSEKLEWREVRGPGSPGSHGSRATGVLRPGEAGETGETGETGGQCPHTAPARLCCLHPPGAGHLNSREWGVSGPHLASASCGAQSSRVLRLKSEEEGMCQPR